MFGNDFWHTNNYEHPSYGPWNALADIAGAYMQRKNTADAEKYAAEYNPMTQEEIAAQQEQANQPQGLLQATQNYGTGSGDNIAQAIGNYQADQNAYKTGIIAPKQSGNSILAAMQNYKPQEIVDTPVLENQTIAQPTNNTAQPDTSQPQTAQPDTQAIEQAQQGLNPADRLPPPQQEQAQPTQPISPADNRINDALNNQYQQYSTDQQTQAQAAQDTAKQKEYDDFAAAKAANPEWYVGDTYVGTDENAKKAALQKQAVETQQKQQQAYKDAYQGFNDRAKTYDGYKSQIVNMKMKAMSEVTRKFGVDAASKVEPMIDEAIKNKIGTLTDDLDNQNRAALQPFLTAPDLNTQAGQQRALWALREYQIANKRLGLQDVDIPDLAKMIDSGNIAISAKDLGGQVQFFAVNKNGSLFDDGTAIKPILSAPKSMTPDTQGRIAESRYEHDSPSGNAKLQSATTLKTTAMREAGANARTTYQVDHRGNGGGTGVSSSQIAAAKAIASNPASTPEQVAQAQQILNAAAGIGGEGSSNSNYDPDNYNDALSHYTKELAYLSSKGYTKGQIIAGAKKYGDFADDLVNNTDWKSWGY